MTQHHYPPTFERWMITITIMLVAVIEVLDMTIVNVALPNMMGALGATSDQITWVLTSYIVSSAILMLLTGFFDQRFGRRKLLMTCIIGFMISSALCGFSTTLSEIVVFRTLQGVFGAGLVPLSQTILRETFPPAEQAKAMAIWGVGIMVGPILGPTLGGYITQYMDWRWVFYINVPFCIMSFLMALRYIKATPISKPFVDWVGIILMVIGVACLQIVLDRGNSADWFESYSILIMTVVGILALIAFFQHGHNNPKNVINFALFKDRNFLLSTSMITIFFTGVLGVLSIQPILLENFFNYPTAMTGLISAPRGIAAAIAMMITSQLTSKIDSRKIMLFGIALAAIGIYKMSGYSLNTSPYYWVTSGIIQGLGMGFFIVPVATMSLSTIPKELTSSGAGLFSFSRNLGISIGIALLSTLISVESQTNWNRLGGSINPFNPNLHTWLQQNNWTIHSQQALVQLQSQLSLQSGMIAFLDSFWIVGICLVALVPLVLLIRVK